MERGFTGLRKKTQGGFDSFESRLSPFYPMRWKPSFFMASALVVIVFCAFARADVVETKGGARLTGKITKIDGVNVTLVTDYAGTLTVKQSEVAALQTDEPRFVRLGTGETVEGTVLPAASGQIQIKGATATVATTADKITATWATGETDPAVAALRHKWSYEVGIDVTGKSGNKEQLGTAFSFRALRTGPHDKLKLYTAFNRQRTNGTLSADQFKAGADYANNYSGRYSWYVRDEGGYDHVKDIGVYNTSATGLGYDIVKETLHLLTARVGLAFRYDNYKNPATGDVQDLGLDFGLHHEYTFNQSKLINNLSYVPSIHDFSDYHFEHESYYEVPLLREKWKLRLGISHDYNSKPGTGVDRLDTTYFTRLVLNWE